MVNSIGTFVDYLAAKNLEKGMACNTCKSVYPISPIDICPQCFSFEPLVTAYNPQNKENLRERIANSPHKNLFRYEPFIPASEQPDYALGMTELIRADELADALGINKGMLYIKFDIGFATYTFKDRGAFLSGQLAFEFNKNGSTVYDFKALGASSTGNLASAIAAAASYFGLKSIILVHANADKKLVDKALSFGANILQVMEDYSSINDKILTPIVYNEDWKSVAWVNSSWRPLYGEGSKTIGFEIAEQLGWRAPDNMVNPVAAGLSLSQMYRALKEFEYFGLISNVRTKVHAVQPSGCNPVVDAWRRGEPFKIIPVKNPKSIAETLCVGRPANGLDVLNVLKESNGSAADATDPEIEKGMELFYKTTGLLAGPVGGVVVASAQKLVENGVIRPDELTVLVITDSQNDAVGKKEGRLFVLEPKIEVVRKTIEDILAEEK